MNNIPTSDEKVFAALAHASVLFSFFGPIGPTIIWILQRKKSRYVRFHALQAMGYQALSFWAFFIGVFVVVFGGVFLVAFVGAIFAQNSSADMQFVPFIVQPIILLGMFGLWGLFFLGGIAGAVFCMANRDFRYPIIGRWLEQKVFSANTSEMESEEWEDNWVGGVCHSTAIIQIWGIVTPLIVWFSQKERSVKLRFQALQAAVYQMIAFAIYVVGMAAYVFVIFAMVFGAMAFSGVSASPNGELPPLAGVIILLFFAVLMIFWFLMMIGTPLYYLLAGLASVLTARGRDFKYPILGGIILRRLKAPASVEGTT